MPEWNLYLKGVLMDGDIKNIKNPEPKEISEKSWRMILNLECTSPAFEGIPDSIVKDYKNWKAWFTAKDPHLISLPGKWEEALSRF